MKKLIHITIFLLVGGTLFAQTRAVDSLQRIVDLQRHDTTELQALLRLGIEYMRTDLQKLKLISHQMLLYSNDGNRANWKSAAYNFLVTYYFQKGQVDSARIALAQGEQLALANPDNYKINFNFNQTAGLFYKDVGELKKALPHMLKNLELWKREDESRAGLLLNLGNLYIRMSDYRTAADYHLKALKLFEKLGNKRGQSFSLQSIANDFFYLKQYQDAQQYYEQSLQLKQALKDSRGIVNTLVGLGDVNKELKNFAKAQRQYQEALQLATELKLTVEVGRIHYQTGLLYRKMTQLGDARSEFNQALQIARDALDSVALARIRSELIGIDLLEQKDKENEIGLQASLYTAIRSGDRLQQSIEYSRLSEYYAQHDQFEKAYDYLKRHSQLEDSLKGNAVIIQMKELTEKYETEKKESEIELLKKEQQVQALLLSREQSNNILITIILISVLIFGGLLVNRYRILNQVKREIEIGKVRNSIARDLHDDIGSTLSSINIMSQVALQENEKTATYLQKIASHSARMMESMSDIVWSINPKNDSAEQLVVKMKEFMAEILEPKEIRYDFQVAPEIEHLKLDVAKRKNIFLLFKEAINNSAKHSEGNQIKIILSVSNSLFQLKVSDNGKGFDYPAKQTGNGLINMEVRAKAAGGTLAAKSIPGLGTDIIITIPIT